MASQPFGDDPSSQQQNPTRSVEEAVAYLTGRLVRPKSTALKRKHLKETMNLTEEQINQAFRNIPRDNLTKSNKCKLRRCFMEFCSAINLQRHRSIHHKKSQVINGFTVEETMKICVESTYYFYVPSELLSKAMDLKRIMNTKYKPSSNELFSILDRGSEMTFLCNDICVNKGCQSWLDSDFKKIGRSLEIVLSDMLAIFSFKIEELLVQGFYNVKNAEVKLLQKQIIDEELLEKSLTEPLVDSDEHPTEVEALGFNVPDDPVSESIEQDDTEWDSETILLEELKAMDEDVSFVFPRFLKFLRGFKYGANEVPFFKAQVQAMNGDGSYKIYVEYSFIQRTDKKLARAIRNHINRVNDVLKMSTAYYLKEQGLIEDLGKFSEEIEVVIEGLPPPKNEESFAAYLLKRGLVERFQLSSETTILALSRRGRKSARRLLKYILQKHKSGLSWDGDFDICDIRVRKGGSLFVISKDAMYNATSYSMLEDLKKFHQILVKHYCCEEMKGSPIFFDELLTDMLEVPKLESDKFDTFQKYMSAHLALMPPVSWSDLLCRLFKVYELLYRKCIYKSGLDSPFDGWRGLCLAHPFIDVYTFKYEESETAKKPYRGNYWHFLRFLRNCYTHAMNYTEVNGVQMTQDIILLDLMVASHFKANITELLKYMIYSHKMFSRAWMQFERSDDHLENDSEDAIVM